MLGSWVLLHEMYKEEFTEAPRWVESPLSGEAPPWPFRGPVGQAQLLDNIKCETNLICHRKSYLGHTSVGNIYSSPASISEVCI